MQFVLCLEHVSPQQSFVIKRIALPQGVHTVGRNKNDEDDKEDDENVIDIELEQTCVSKRHAMFGIQINSFNKILEIDKHVCFVQDLNSTNGTRIIVPHKCNDGTIQTTEIVLKPNRYYQVLHKNKVSCGFNF